MPSDHVCAKHISKDMISTAYHAEFKERVLLDAPKKPDLFVNAIFALFLNCPKFFTWSNKPRKLHRRKNVLCKHSNDVSRKVIKSTH